MDSSQMPVFRLPVVVLTLSIAFLFPGCGSSDAPSLEPVQETSQAETNSTAASPKEAETLEPTVDPQIEVKAVFRKLLENRTEPDPDEWQKADKKLIAFGATAVPTLAAEMASSEADARELASMYLARLGPEAKDAAPALEPALKDESPFTQVNAASTLTHFPEYREKAIPVLIELTRHEDASTRVTAIYALGSLDSHSEEQLNAVKAALEDSDADVQLAAIKVLGQIGLPAETSLKELQSLIDDTETDELIREAALSSKSQIEKARQ